MAERIRGTVLWFDIKKGFGFIKAGDREYFAHYSKIIAPVGEFRLLNENETVEFEPFEADRGNGQKKWQAKDIHVIKEN